jgi:hypothetical protein
MRKQILTTKAMPVVALGLAAALTFGGGARADQTADDARSLDAASATSGLLTAAAVESGATATIPWLVASSLVGTHLGTAAPESTAQGDIRSLGATDLTGGTFSSVAVESGGSMASSAGGRGWQRTGTLTGQVFTAATTESTAQGGIRSLNPQVVSGESFGGGASSESTGAEGIRSLSPFGLTSETFG